jgi:hypothetical protein
MKLRKQKRHVGGLSRLAVACTKMPSKREITSNIHRLAPAYLGGEADEIWRLPKDVGSPGDFSREFTERRGTNTWRGALRLL